MTAEILLRYLHFISIFAIVGALLAEHLLLKPRLTRLAITQLTRIDAIYGIAAVVLLAAGFTLWLGGVGKPSFFYTKNWVFHVKLGLFVVLGLLSIYPSVFFMKNRKGDPEEEIEIPAMVFWMLRLELLILLIIPLLAGLMAKGVGFFG